MPSLQEYALISQYEPRVEMFRRAPDIWSYHETVGIASLARFESMTCEIPMADIYADVVFEENP